MNNSIENLTDMEVQVLNLIRFERGRNGPVNSKDIDANFPAIRGQGKEYIDRLLELKLIQRTHSPLPAGNGKYYAVCEQWH